MMGNFFNRMYYGKGGKEDYTKDDLPDNRWQLFLAMLRLNIGKLVSTNLLYVLFLLPTIVWVFMNLQVISVLIEEAQTDRIPEYITMFIYGLAPCLFILSPALAGTSYITRNMARDQNVWVWADFWYAVKSNWKQALGLGAINSVLLVLFYVSNMLYGVLAVDNMMFYTLRIVLIVFAVVWVCVNLYIWQMMVTYQLKLGQLIKNSLIIAIARLPQTLFMLFFTLLVPVIVYLTMNGIAFLVGIVFYVFLGFSVTCLALNSMTNGIFDKVINVRIKGARVNQGLRDMADLDEPENET